MIHGSHKQPEQVLIDEGQAAKRLGVSRNHLGNLRRAGRIPYVKLGRIVRYDIRRLDQWLAEQMEGAREKASINSAK